MARGRPREFDTDQALDAAMELFWRHGYEGTSLSALAEAMEINMPSLYAAFGNKESLFKLAVDRYIQKPANYLRRALEQPTARQVVEQALSGAIDMIQHPRSADGCLLVHGALATSPSSDSIRQELSRRRAGAENAVCQRFQHAIDAGDLPTTVDPVKLARYLMTVIWGLSVQAAGGATRDQLGEVAEIVLQCWPV
jgi:AcrR family transcriptional regulator